MLLVDGDFARQWEARVEAQMRNRGKGFHASVRAEVEFADDAALITHVGDPRHRALGWNGAATARRCPAGWPRMSALIAYSSRTRTRTSAASDDWSDTYWS